jgi:hypothetical protein
VRATDVRATEEPMRERKDGAEDSIHLVLISL